mgnify:CR=1 FL=1
MPLFVRTDMVTGIDAADLARRTAEHTVVAIDIPIGVPEAGPRACDVEAGRVGR